MVQHLPYGSWPSPIGPELLVAGASRPSDVHARGGVTWWSEARSSAGGREQIVRRDPDGSTVDLLPVGWGVRSRVHEYGGAAWWVGGPPGAEAVFFVNVADQRLYRIGPGPLSPVPLSPVPLSPVPLSPVPLSPVPPVPHALRHADGVLTPDHRWVVAVRERHGAPRNDRSASVDVRNEIVALPAAGAGDGGFEVVILVTGPDFVAAPRVSPDGLRLAWLVWNHPDMPWDGTELWVADLAPDAAGRPALTGARRVAGGREEALVQPEWGPDGRLHVGSDVSDWWNVYRFEDDVLEPVCPVEAEVGQPAWVFGQSRYQVGPDGTVWFTYSGDDGAHLVSVPPGAAPVDRPLDCLALRQLRLDGDRLVAIATEATREPSVVQLTVDQLTVDQLTVVQLTVDPDGRPPRAPDGDPAELGRAVLRPPRENPLDAGDVSCARRIDFPSADGRTAHAWFYPPSGAGVNGLHDELPPLLVGVHGGPTAASDPGFTLSTQFWTSRGFAVVDVDYGGSTGYGRPYRRLLDGGWGVVDVEDVCAAARWLAGQGLVDPTRLAIRGGSAGGFTALAALATTDVFAAGASRYGVTDLASLARDTHKFESRYLDRLVGPWPEAAAVYAERSPLSHLDGLDVPLIVLQGLKDEVVPPAQAELIVSGLRARGIPHAYLTFPDELHGFRQPETIVRAITAELSFYAQIFGFELADDVQPVEITPSPGGRAG